MIYDSATQNKLLEPTPPSVARRLERSVTGNHVFRAYIDESNERRDQSKYNPGSVRSSVDSERESERCEDVFPLQQRETPLLVTDRTIGLATREQHKLTLHHEAKETLAAFFEAKKGTTQASRRRSAGFGSPGALNALKTAMKRKLHIDPRAGVKPQDHFYRNLIPAIPRTRHNLGARLDAITKASTAASRRRVVMHDDKVLKRFNVQRANGADPGVTDKAPGAITGNGPNGSNNSAGLSIPPNPALPELDIRVLAGFRKIVSVWREHRKKREEMALNLVTNVAKSGKARRDVSVASPSVVGFLSRRVVREVPALKFFDDDETEQQQEVLRAIRLRAGYTPHGRHPERGNLKDTPRGVCYTMDEFGCRRTKFLQKTVRTSLRQNAHRKQETITVEKAIGRSLHRKMNKRVAAKEKAIVAVQRDFTKQQQLLTQKLRSQLALHHAESEKLYAKRLALMLRNDTNLPAYQATKELHLARVRSRKAVLLEQCRTLCVFGKLLEIVQSESQHSANEELSASEALILELFKSVVESDQVLTPVLVDAIRTQLGELDMETSIVQRLLQVINSQ